MQQKPPPSRPPPLREALPPPPPKPGSREEQDAAATSATNAKASEEASKNWAEEAKKAANTDTTVSIKGAPADAAATRALIEESLAAQREEDYARIKFWASNDPTSPASFIGGTWERVEGEFIMGASRAYPVGTTGGSATHTQTTAEMPSHSHSGSTGSAGSHSHSASTDSAGWHSHSARPIGRVRIRMMQLSTVTVAPQVETAVWLVRPWLTVTATIRLL